jgi:hypothetical protein
MIKQWNNEEQFQFIIEQNVLFSTTITNGNRDLMNDNAWNIVFRLIELKMENYVERIEWKDSLTMILV